MLHWGLDCGPEFEGELNCSPTFKGVGVSAAKNQKHNCCQDPQAQMQSLPPEIRSWTAEADEKLQYHEISLPR